MADRQTNEDLGLPKIIRRPDLQSKYKRRATFIVATLCWAAWFYLFTPLFTLLAWWFGGTRVEHHIFMDTEHSRLVLLLYALAVLLAGALLIAWAVYNYLRFRHTERRNPPAHLNKQRLAEYFDVELATVDQIQTVKIGYVSHDEHGVIQAVRPGQARPTI